MSLVRTGRRPRVLILGTGAMASALGARLARYGRAAVTLAGTWPEALDAIALEGITVEEQGGTWLARVDASPLAGPFGPADFVLVLVKSPRTAAVAATAARVLLPTSLVVSLQNGLGHREVLEERAGAERVAVGVATMGATLLGPGWVRVIAGPIVLGAEPATAAAVVRLGELLRASRIETELTPEVEKAVWSKLAVNCAINPLSALLGRPNGALLEGPEPRETLENAAEEVGAVAAAKGIRLEVDPAALALEVAEKTASNRSSMLQDLERGAITEIDALNGAVVREGHEVGVPTPVNEYLWRRVREKEGRPLPAPGPQPDGAA
jgi:2-dehydropantoate 2-reductase